MAAYRPLGPFPQFLLADGTVNNGGLINFYETDLTTLKNTYSDDTLTTVNANPVVLDASGRPSVDIWGSGAYGVVITDSLGANPRTLNNVQPDSGASTQIPALVSGEFLTNDASNLLWQAIRQVPDPTGFANNLLSTDGTLLFWQAAASAGFTPVITANSIKLDTIMIQWGTDTIPSSGAFTSNKAFTYGSAFTTLYHVGAVINGSSGVASAGGIPVLSVGARSASGATAFIDMNGFQNIINSVGFTWFAIGSVPA